MLEEIVGNNGELKELVPSVVVDASYHIVALNNTAKKMFGEAIGKTCYKTLYGFDRACFEMGIKCPIHDKTSGTDIMSMDYETYVRSYGQLPIGGMYWESLVNITSIETIRSSVLDPLSGLYNRRFAESFLEKSFTQWSRYGQPFSLMFIDIDNLKNINDTYGHIVGDKVIERLSTCLKTMIRSSDVASRYGGDEFLLILPNTNINSGEQAAVRIMKCIELIKLDVPITVSIGLTQVLKEDTSYKDIVRRADKAMYIAKRSGKGKVCVAKNAEDLYLIQIAEGGAEDE